MMTLEQILEQKRDVVFRSLKFVDSNGNGRIDQNVLGEGYREEVDTLDTDGRITVMECWKYLKEGRVQEIRTEGLHVLGVDAVPILGRVLREHEASIDQKMQAITEVQKIGPAALEAVRTDGRALVENILTTKRATLTPDGDLLMVALELFGAPEDFEGIYSIIAYRCSTLCFLSSSPYDPRREQTMEVLAKVSPQQFVSMMTETKDTWQFRSVESSQETKARVIDRLVENYRKNPASRKEALIALIKNEEVAADLRIKAIQALVENDDLSPAVMYIAYHVLENNPSSEKSALQSKIEELIANRKLSQRELLVIIEDEDISLEIRGPLFRKYLGQIRIRSLSDIEKINQISAAKVFESITIEYLITNGEPAILGYLSKVLMPNEVFKFIVGLDKRGVLKSRADRVMVTKFLRQERYNLREQLQNQVGNKEHTPLKQIAKQLLEEMRQEKVRADVAVVGLRRLYLQDPDAQPQTPNTYAYELSLEVLNAPALDMEKGHYSTRLIIVDEHGRRWVQNCNQTGTELCPLTEELPLNMPAVFYLNPPKTRLGYNSYRVFLSTRRQRVRAYIEYVKTEEENSFGSGGKEEVVGRSRSFTLTHPDYGRGDYWRKEIKTGSVTGVNVAESGAPIYSKIITVKEEGDGRVLIVDSVGGGPSYNSGPTSYLNLKTGAITFFGQGRGAMAEFANPVDDPILYFRKINELLAIATAVARDTEGNKAFIRSVVSYLRHVKKQMRKQIDDPLGRGRPL